MTKNEAESNVRYFNSFFKPGDKIKWRANINLPYREYILRLSAYVKIHGSEFYPMAHFKEKIEPVSVELNHVQYEIPF